MFQPPLAANNRPLASLARTGLEKLFHSWLGASGRRYVCSVHPIDESPAIDCRRAVVAAVRRDRTGAASLVFVFQPAEGGNIEMWTQRARASGAEEWHIHLLAETPQARASVVSDLLGQRRLDA